MLATLPLATDDGRTITGHLDGGVAGSGQRRVRASDVSGGDARRDRRRRSRTASLPPKDDPRRTVPAEQWHYVDDSTVAVTPPAGERTRGTIYEFVYEARDPIVHGLGFSAMRDFVSFARYSPADDQGVPNPLFVDARAGARARWWPWVSSQSGRMARDFVYQGFNEDPAGRRVFDGMTPYVAGARPHVGQRPVSRRRAAITRQHEDHNYPMDEFPFTFATTTESADGQDRRAAGLGLARPRVPARTSSRWTPNPSTTAPMLRSSSPDTSGRALELPPKRALLDARDRASAGQRRVPRPGQPGAVPWPYYPVGVRRDGAVGCGTGWSRRRRARRRWPTARR